MTSFDPDDHPVDYYQKYREYGNLISHLNTDILELRNKLERYEQTKYELSLAENKLRFACAVVESIYDILSGLGWPEINIHDFLPIIKSVNHQQYGLKENPLEKWYAAKERKESENN